jgi:hypothetical protein
LKTKVVQFSKTLVITHPMRQCLILHGLLDPEYEGTTSLETRGTIHPLTQSGIPDNSNP